MYVPMRGLNTRRRRGKGWKARVLRQHSDVQTSKHPDLSPSVRLSLPSPLELEYHLFFFVVLSFSISFFDLLPSPLHFSVPPPPRRHSVSALCAGNSSAPMSLTGCQCSAGAGNNEYSSLHLPSRSLLPPSDPLDSDVYMHTKVRESRRDRGTERDREGGIHEHSLRSDHSKSSLLVEQPRWTPWIDCSLFTLEHSHIMAGPTLDVVDYPLSSKLNLSDWFSGSACDQSLISLYSLFIGTCRSDSSPFIWRDYRCMIGW